VNSGSLLANHCFGSPFSLSVDPLEDREYHMYVRKRKTYQCHGNPRY